MHRGGWDTSQRDPPHSQAMHGYGDSTTPTRGGGGGWGGGGGAGAGAGAGGGGQGQHHHRHHQHRSPGHPTPSPRFSPLSLADEPSGPEGITAMAIADAIFEEIASGGTETRAPELTDRHLEMLAFVFKEQHLGNALELVQAGKVKRLVAERSGRACYQVKGKSSSRKGSEEAYLCFPEHYCSCRAFQWDVLTRGEQLICKHQLAARIADATGAHVVSVVSDILLAQLLESYARGDVGDGGGRGGGPRGNRRWGGGGGGGGRQPSPTFR